MERTKVTRETARKWCKNLFDTSRENMLAKSWEDNGRFGDYMFCRGVMAAMELAELITREESKQMDHELSSQFWEDTYKAGAAVVNDAVDELLADMDEETIYTIDFGTGAGNFEVRGTLAEAKRQADAEICYTQQPVKICDQDGKEVSTRHWYGCYADDDEFENPIYVGNGVYDDWYDYD